MKHPAKVPTSQNNEIHIWMVEDNILYRNTVVSLINTQTDMICDKIFLTCEETLETLRNAKSPDVILMDIGLPGMSGVEGVFKIKSLYPAIQVIMITVYDDNENIYQALCNGATGYLLKASTEEVIIQAIRDVISGGSPMNPSIARRVVESFARNRQRNTEYHLSARELEILDQIIHGFTNKQIGNKLFMSSHTVDSHLRRIYEKMHVHTRTEATAKALNEHLV